ncbi:MAG: dipeptidase [Planctomycetes bacterium]|nr:dipeptidase [Planctomycetota bacterium]
MQPTFARPPRPYSEDVVARARALHAASPVLDLHADTFIAVRYFGADLRRKTPPPLGWNPLRTHCDLPRFKQGGMRGQGFGVVIPPFVRAGQRFDHARRTLRLMGRTFARCPDDLALVRGPDELLAARAAGRLGGFFGVEGAHALDGDPERVAWLRAQGVAYLGLCHFQTNDVVASSGARRPPYRGLGPIGAAVVDACNEHGVLVDLAHCHEASFFEAIARSRAPVVVTHGAARALADHHRNLTDEQLRAIGHSGGVVGVIFYPWYLSRKLRDDVDRVVDHMEHIAQVAGPEHVALGSDFDGFVWTVQGLPDVAAMPRLTEALVARGWRDEHVRGALGENYLRAWGRALAVSGSAASGARAPHPPRT